MASSYNPHIRSHSKSQMYLFKILHIISSIPPSIQQQSSPNNNKGVGIDLNLAFSSITDTEESESSNNNNNSERQEEPKVVDVDVDDVASELENEGDTKTTTFRGDSNCIDLLIEAARVLSEKNESEEEKQIETESPSHEESVKKQKERWVVVDLYETEPVVRSKRGRNQTLPFRFRDSVVEPLKRKGRNQRMSSTTNSKKRLLR
ncbi:unnamed protein product [Lathyrus sativus]|nr:unnamed protein product [Lathyrus sativus]